MAHTVVLTALTLLLALAISSSAYAVTSADPERTTQHQWVAAHFEAASNPGDFFSFVYHGQVSAELLKTWTVTKEKRDLGQGQVEHTITATDPGTGLTLRCVGTEYGDFPAVEWVLYFKNSGTADTPIIEDIRALDAGLALARDKTACVHYANGSECRLEDFAPQTAPLGPNANDPQGPWRGDKNPVHLESKGGRSSCGTLPFFNLEMDGHGAVVALGWTGDWAADFYRTDTDVHVRGGMRKTHLTLHPGEEIRSPRVLLLFWNGDALRGHNLLRQFILAHHTPQANGKPARPPISLATWGGNFAAKHIAHAQWFKDNKVPIEYLWVDAGWFGNDEAKEGANVFNSQWWRYVGDWHANPGFFPQGLKPVGDAVKAMGMGFLLWLEPERVYKGTTWTREHPDYLLGPSGDNYLLNLGNPDARKMLAEHLVGLINDGSIGCYRQDFNTDSRGFWEAADTPDRVGITEIRYITGLYALWDELLKRCPGLLIDNCASGGRRINLETISRSIPLWRSDVQCYPNFNLTAMQNQTQGLGLWVPLSAGCAEREDTYAFRSALGPGLVLCMGDFEKDQNKHFSIPWLQTMLAQFNRVRPYFLGDFYPLLSYSAAGDAWAAWQYDRPDLGEGTVVAFRREGSPFPTLTAKLKGLAPDARYVFTDLDSNETAEYSGKELAETGLRIQVDAQPGTRLYTYKRK